MTKETYKQNAPDIIKALIIVVVTFIVYIQSFHGGFIWDDQIFIVENRFLLNLEGLWSIWFTTELSHQYYPLVSTFFWIERHIFGLNPVGYHITNIAFHSINALLVWVVCKRLKLRGAFVIALIFSLHPVHVDSAGFINELKNLASAFFYLLALLCFLTFEDKDSKRWYILMLITFILALLSKTVAGTLPAALLIIRWMRHKDIGLKYIATLLPLFIIAAAFAIITITQEVENTGVNIGLSFAERVLVAGRGSWFYVAKLLYPANLSFIYPRLEPDIANFSHWLYPAGVIAAVSILLLFSKRLSRGPAAAIVFFLVTIFPAMGFVDINFFNFSYVADHFQYLASLGIIALTIGIACHLIKNLPKPASYIAALPVIFILAVLTWNRSGLGADHEMLWRDTIEKNPASWIAHNGLGTILLADKRIEESIDEFQQAIRINPNNEKARNNLGNALTETKRFDEAIAQYNIALMITPENPLTLINLGINYTLQGYLKDATASFVRSIEINPYDPYAFYNYALVLEKLGSQDDAEHAYLRALELNPVDTESKNNLANIYMGRNNPKRAETLYNEVIRLHPGHAQALNNLGIIMNMRKDNLKSISYFERAVKADPEYSNAHYNFAITLDDLGRSKDALERYRIVLRLDPLHAEANNNIGSILLKEGNMEEAENYFKEALRLAPSNPAYKKNLEFTKKLKRNTKKEHLGAH